MKLSFLSYFKKAKVVDAPAPVIAPAPIAKPASERFGKTVMPNMSRMMEPDASPAPIAAPLTPPPVPAGRRTISFGGEMPSAMATTTPLVPLVTRATERTVALPLRELLPQIPAELIEQTEVDPTHRVLLNATELERGLASGRPVVSLRAIYQQAPTIFTSEIGPDDQREVTLSFDRVLQQIARLHVRPDQMCDEVLPQMETPFSQVTKEDSERFGTPLTPLPAISPAAVLESPVEAESLVPTPAPVAMPAPAATAPVETPTVKAPSLAPIRLPMPSPTALATPSLAQAESPPSDAVPSEPPQPSGFRLIQPQISPNGTGAPATERVPASSGPPVPIPLPAPFAPPAPARIPFKVTPPASDLCPPPPLPLQPAAGAEAAPARFFRRRVTHPVVVARDPAGVSPFQFTGSLESIPESAQIELPFAIVEPQLSLGRVAISPGAILRRHAGGISCRLRFRRRRDARLAAIAGSAAEFA